MLKVEACILEKIFELQTIPSVSAANFTNITNSLSGNLQMEWIILNSKSFSELSFSLIKATVRPELILRK